MDYMDIDQVLDVPDTPDRLAAQNSSNVRDCIEKKNNSSDTNNSGTKGFSDEGFRNQPRDKGKLFTDNGSKRHLFRPSKNLSISDKSERHGNSTGSTFGNSSSFPLKRMVGNKTANHETKHSIHSRPVEKGKAFCTSQSQSSARQVDRAVVDLTEQNGHTQAFEKGIRADESRKGSLSAHAFSSLHSTPNSSSAFSNICKVKEKVDDTSKVGSSFDRGKGIDFIVDSQPKPGKNMSTSLHPITSRRVTGQKRLVRNGCISPHNIAKAKQSTEAPDNSSVCAGQNDAGTVWPDGPPPSVNIRDLIADNSSVRAGQNDTGTVWPDGPPPSVNIRDLIAEANDSHKVKGKGVINHHFSSKGPDAKTMHFSTRSSTTLNEKADGASDATGDADRFDGLGGWRSTRNRTRKIDPPFSDEDRNLSSGKNDPCFINQQHENGVVRRDYMYESSSRNRNNYPKDPDLVSCQHVSAPHLVQRVSHLRHQSGQINEHQHAANTLIKRQKQGSTSSNRGECSTSAFDDLELVCLGSSGEPSSLRSTRDQTHHDVGILDPVIEIDEFSPEVRNSGSRNIGCSSNNGSDVRARQVEADEMLARELQEELYNEVPGVGEIDAHIALALQQENNSPHAFSSGGPHVFHPRGSLRSNLHGHSLSSQNPSVRRGTQARVTTSTRMARLRGRFAGRFPGQPPSGRFPGQPRTISSRERTPLFPPNMDLDMRMHILEALEAFSDMEMTGGFSQVQRDFNENDYEMLLALDENNHQHGGASLAQINGLPESTVQTENLEEACAICLESPSIGDIIRHLPCLHRFHKDCIDPWLRRRTSCPVCKSSIT